MQIISLMLDKLVDTDSLVHRITVTYHNTSANATQRNIRKNCIKFEIMVMLSYLYLLNIEQIDPDAACQTAIIKIMTNI